MKRTRQERNAIDVEHKTKEIKASRDYSGEASPYRDWVEANEGYDFYDLDHSDFSVEEAPDTDDKWDAFLEVYSTLQGRQKEVADLVLKGMSRQEDIARALDLPQQHISRALARIKKKIESNMV